MKKQLFIFFDRILSIFNNSNSSAHSLDITQNILAQLFHFIDPKNELKKARENLEKGNLDNLLYQLAENRYQNFKNKNELIITEKYIFNSVSSFEDLFSNKK